MRSINRLAPSELSAELKKLSKNARRLVFIGVTSGSGKTTAFQAFIKANADESIGITAVGIDSQEGASAVMIPAGALAATAASCIAHSDLTREILCDTGIFTQLGEILLLKAHSYGKLELAGPSITADLIKAAKLLNGYGAVKTFIDGAHDRINIASIPETATILALKYIETKSLENFARETAELLTDLNLPTAPQNLCKLYLETIDEHGTYDKNSNKVFTIYSNNYKTFGPIFEIDDSTQAVCIRGAVTNSLIDEILENTPQNRRGGWKNLILLVEDGTRIFIDKRRRELLRTTLGVKITAARPINILCLAINPGMYAQEPNFAESLIKTLTEHIALPIVDVVGGWYAAGI